MSFLNMSNKDNTLRQNWSLRKTLHLWTKGQSVPKATPSGVISFIFYFSLYSLFPSLQQYQQALLDLPVTQSYFALGSLGPAVSGDCMSLKKHA